jgi:hypothetical protein
MVFFLKKISDSVMQCLRKGISINVTMFIAVHF